LRRTRSAEYNQLLGDKRASAAKTSWCNWGSADKLKTISYGKDGRSAPSRMSLLAEERRVHFSTGQ